MEINKCLQDPNTVYSDQYMPLALMPAVIEAIQNGGGGGAKFGPYELCISTNKTIVNNGTASLTASLAKGADGTTYILPNDDKRHYFTPVSVGIDGNHLPLLGYSAVYDLNYEMTPIVSVINNTGNSITLEAGTAIMIVLSDVELEPLESGDA